MKEEKRAARRREIMEVAYTVLGEVGYTATSMLTVARRARASNETMYNWFGSKQGLFQAMVEENARAAAEILDEQLAAGGDIATSLDRLGPALLRLVTGDRAVALNRAAAADADDTGTLGQTIATSGRERIAPMLQQVFANATEAGQLQCPNPAEAAELYISLLIGDLQIRRVIGVIPPPDGAEIERRSKRARQVLMREYGG